MASNISVKITADARPFALSQRRKRPRQESKFPREHGLMAGEISLKAKLGKRDYTLRLGHAQIYELETGAPWRDSPSQRQIALMSVNLLNPDGPRGPLPKLFARLRGGDWTMPDVTETIRLALIGGGASAEDAQALVAAHVLDKPLAQSVQLAIAAMGAALVGKAAAA